MRESDEGSVAQATNTLAKYQWDNEDNNNIGDRGCLSLMKAQWPNLKELYLSTNEIMKMAIRLEREPTDTCVTESGQFGAIGYMNSDSDGGSLIINIHSNPSESKL